MRRAGRPPGVPSGNPLQVPAGVPANTRGPTVDVAAPPHPASGRTRVNA
ncbi:chaplin family protein [Streptomyces sp. NPDC054961]